MKTLLKNCKLIQGLSNIIIEDDKISDIIPCSQIDIDQTIDIKGNLVIPGIIDPHVHVRDLQQAYKEDWETASKEMLDSKWAKQVKGRAIKLAEMMKTGEK